MSISTSDKVDYFIESCKYKKDQLYQEHKDISTMEEVKYYVNKLAKKLKKNYSVDNSTTDEESDDFDDTSRYSFASIDLNALAIFNQHLQALVALDLGSTDNTADDIIEIVKDDYSNCNRGM